MNLTKSDFLKYQVCPSYLWLWKFKKEVVPQDEAAEIERRLEQGNEVEAYARELFPGGALVKEFGQAAQTKTKKLVEDNVKIIFQATVVTPSGLLAMADAIEFDEDCKNWTLYEVKSTNSVKKEHIYDVAFQKAAFQEAGYNIGRTGVVHTNKEYVRHGEVKPVEMLVKEDISEKVDEALPTIKQQISDALKVLDQKDEPTSCSCRLKARSGHCPTFKYLNPDIPEYSVFNISRLRGRKLEELVDNDVLEVADVPEDMKLSTNQANQVNTAKTNKPMIDKDQIKNILGDLEFPLYFLDYETISTAIPLFNNTIPFQQVPFQYSLHILREPDGELEHCEYLSEDTNDGNILNLIKSLHEAIDGVGSVIVWNQSFEVKRNEEMAVLHPEYKDFLHDLNGRVFDLMEIFSKQHYVHPDFMGSSSVKAVLPVLVPDLSYKELYIQNGALASAKWYEAVMSEMSDEERQHIFDSLIKYCKLDTLAMVKIYFALLAIVDSKYHYRQKSGIMTKNELQLFKILQANFAEDYLVLPQEHISALVDSSVKGQWSQAAFKHINSWSIDFAICDKETTKPLLAIELDDKTHEDKERIERDVEVERIFREIGLQLLRIRPDQVADEIVVVAVRQRL